MDFVVSAAGLLPILAPAALALGYTLATVLVVFYAERKLSALYQDRLGPMETGPYGTLQAVADLLKLLQKSFAQVRGADGLLFVLAPVIVFAAVFAGFAAVPLAGPGGGGTAAGGGASVGVLYTLAVVSLDVAGIWLAGWASYSKYPLLGAMRGIAQLLSYEVPLGLTVLAVALWGGTLDLGTLSAQQSAGAPAAIHILGIVSWADVRPAGGLFCWHLLQTPWMPPLFVIFYICALAECNRAPFDMPEAESELVGGFHTEYSGFAFGLFFLAEYALMILVCLLASFLFLGGWATPLPNLGPLRLDAWTTGPVWAVFWLTAKTWTLLASQIWVRWTLPRLRIDQLLYLGWQVLTPAALVLLLAQAVWK